MHYSCKKVVVIAVVLITCVSPAFSQGASWNAAIALFNQQRWADAASAFATLEQQSPGRTDALLCRARALTQLGQLHEAESAIGMYVDGHPASTEGLRELGYIRFRLRKPTA